MAPELVYGLFSGKLPNFRAADNVLPLAMLAAGLFFSRKTHPMLKFFFMIFGALLLLSNANRAMNESDLLLMIGQQLSIEII